jgi:hypothetical protein
MEKSEKLISISAGLLLTAVIVYQKFANNSLKKERKEADAETTKSKLDLQILKDTLAGKDGEKPRATEESPDNIELAEEAINVIKEEKKSMDQVDKFKKRYGTPVSN